LIRPTQPQHLRLAARSNNHQWHSWAVARHGLMPTLMINKIRLAGSFTFSTTQRHSWSLGR
ncbi:MAG: hypothetical protein N6V49_14600, partial [Serratia symbiotica]|nr:hypothetical protein [Serratia symbiotica]